MCEIINFGEGRRNRAAKRLAQMGKQMGKRIDHNRKLSVQELLTKEWTEEYMRKGLGLSKLIFHIIEQYGCIRCMDRKIYVFEDIKRDVKYCDMHPEIGDKRFKAPLWVKVSGEWYFVEMYTDSASLNAYKNKLVEMGNYDIKGFVVDLYGIKTKEVKRMLESNDLAGLVKKINDEYYEFPRADKTTSACRASVTFGSEKNCRDCTYKVLRKMHHYAIVEGTEAETGDKHLVLLYDDYEPKEYAKKYREEYGELGLPLLYAKWNKLIEDNWYECIQRNNNLSKRLVLK